MRTYKKELEAIASDLVSQSAKLKEKPNYSNRDFLNSIIIFQTALFAKMYENQDYDCMALDDRIKMAESCGSAIRELIHTYTGLDTHDVKDFL